MKHIQFSFFKIFLSPIIMVPLVYSVFCKAVHKNIYIKTMISLNSGHVVSPHQCQHQVAYHFKTIFQV